jgi:hypothetical protein
VIDGIVPGCCGRRRDGDAALDRQQVTAAHQQQQLIFCFMPFTTESQ